MPLDNVNISDRFVSQCSPVVSSSYDTCGTVTRASISYLSKTDLEALFAPAGLFADLDSWFMHAIEMKACGVQRNVMYDWIMANADHTVWRGAMTGIKGVKTESLLQPFVFGSQVGVAIDGYWKIVAGGTISDSVGTPGSAAATTTALGTINFNPNTIKAENGSTTIAFNATGVRFIRVQTRAEFSMPYDASFFVPRMTIHIFSTGAGGVSQHGQWQVLGAINTDYGIDVAIRNQNISGQEAFDATPVAASNAVLIPGVNNVNDYEVWCNNRPTIDQRKRVPFWFQTFRSSRCVDDFYKEVFQKLMQTNPAFREFGDLDLAERNRQDEQRDQSEFVNSFFFNKPSSSNQTTSLWQNLEPIYTAEGNGIKLGLGSKLVGRRAEFIGVKEQLRLCDRVFDLVGNPLKMYEWLDLNYTLMRTRSTGLKGKKITDIDWYTTSAFRALFQQAYVEYAAGVWGTQARWNFDFNQVGEAGMLFDSYTFQYPSGIKINLVSNDWFDDFLDQMTEAGSPNRGNLLLALDIGKPGPNGGDIYWADMGTTRQTSKSADLAALARLDSTMRCVMKHTSVEQTLRSSTGTVIVECPSSHAWVEGFSLSKPVITAKTTPYTDLY